MSQWGQTENMQIVDGVLSLESITEENVGKSYELWIQNEGNWVWGRLWCRGRAVDLTLNVLKSSRMLHIHAIYY